MGTKKAQIEGVFGFSKDFFVSFTWCVFRRLSSRTRARRRVVVSGFDALPMGRTSKAIKSARTQPTAAVHSAGDGTIIRQPPTDDGAEPPLRRVAVVGSGVAGLSAAYILHRNGVRVTLYEAAAACGGHALTVDSTAGPVDLGFQVSAARGCVLLKRNEMDMANKTRAPTSSER